MRTNSKDDGNSSNHFALLEWTDPILHRQSKQSSMQLYCMSKPLFIPAVWNDSCASVATTVFDDDWLL